MSGQDMRKLMENLKKKTPKKKLDESVGGTPIANDIMELAAKLEAIQNTPETEENPVELSIIDEESETGLPVDKIVQERYGDDRNIVIQYLSEGNDKVDLILRIMELVPDEERDELIRSAREY